MNWVVQANEAMASMMSHESWNKSLSKYVKKLLFMATLMNLLPWGYTTCALKESNHRILQVFHTFSIHFILNINMMEIKIYCISKDFLYKEFCTNPMENFLASRQLYWLGKVALMEETKILQKLIPAWHINLHPTGHPQQIIQHTYPHALHIMVGIMEDNKEGKFSDWFPCATKDSKE
eukprot:2039405-Ditylum_brightwellii.AAC.1